MGAELDAVDEAPQDLGSLGLDSRVVEGLLEAGSLVGVDVAGRGWRRRVGSSGTRANSRSNASCSPSRVPKRWVRLRL